MKNKIIMFALMCALMVGLFPLHHAEKAYAATETTADDVKYRDVAEFITGAGYADFIKNDDAYYLALLHGDYLYVYEMKNFVDLFLGYDGSLMSVLFEPRNSEYREIITYRYYNFDKASFESMYDIVDNPAISKYTPLYEIGGYYNGDLGTYYSYSGSLDDILYSDLPIYSIVNKSSSTKFSYYTDTSTVVYESTLKVGYNFPTWCQDAGLNCIPSSNESATNIPYNYNDYWHIVRKTSNGKWLLTTIGSNLGQAKMNLRISEDMKNLKVYEFSGDDTAVLNVRQYEYDTDGWKVRSYDSYGYDELVQGSIDLGSGTGIDGTRMIAYTNTPIYSNDGYGVAFPISSEYYEVEMPDIPDSVITPTPVPDDGLGSVGGLNIVTYTSQIRAEVKADSVNMRDYPSLEGKAIAAFIKTWDVDVLGYVYDEEGATWYYCKTVRDDIEYIGFIKAEYLTVLSVENNDFGLGDIDFGDISLEDAPEIIKTAKDSFVELLGFVGVVPMMIGAVFGFLPSWCLGIVCITIVTLCFIAIIKRG